MKKTTLLKTIILLLTLTTGSTSVWAADPVTTYVFTSRDWAATCNDVEANWTKNVRAGGYTAGQGTQITTSSSGANATSPKSFTKVKKIAVTYCTNNKTGVGTIKVKVGSGTEKSFSVTAPSSGGTTLKTTEFTFSPVETGAVTLTATCTTNSVYIYSIAITEEGSTDPYITVTSPIDIEADATSGEFTYTVNNPVVGAELSASSTDDWISNMAVDEENNKVTFNTTANTIATPREGTITISYTKDDSELTSTDVTITQAKAVVTLKYTLVTKITPGKHYIFVGNNSGTYYAMGYQNTNNRPGVSITVSDGKTSFDSDAGVYEVQINGDVETGYYTIYDEQTSGYLYAACGTGTGNNMRTEAELDDDGNGLWIMSVNSSGIVSAKSSNSSLSRPWMRFNSGNSLFSCYLNSDSQSDIYLFERDGDTSVQNVDVTINAACNDGEGNYYGTYSNEFAFVVPEGLTVSEIGIVDGKLYVEDYATGAVVPANTGVMISSASAGDKTLTLAVGGTSKLDTDNCLKASGGAGIDADAMATAAPSCKYYRLTMHNGEQIGFWWGADEGAAFALAANKAYLAVPSGGVSAHEFVWFNEGETTAISEVRGLNSDVRGEYFNLNGQRVAQPTKGLYIINGKKVVIK